MKNMRTRQKKEEALARNEEYSSLTRKEKIVRLEGYRAKKQRIKLGIWEDWLKEHPRDLG